MQINLVTRTSALALKQAELVKELLLARHNFLTVKLLPIISEGDKIIDEPLYQRGGKGLFVKELEQKLLDGSADIAVHSLKDMEVTLPDALTIGAVLPRDDVRDVFISNKYTSLEQLPQGALIGTSSLRRKAQLLNFNPNLVIQVLRGNVDTRLKKLAALNLDGIILAAAGLKRLGLESHIKEYIATTTMLPAIGQGAIGIECRKDNVKVMALLQSINHLPTMIAVNSERALNSSLNGGCHLPVAGLATVTDNNLTLKAMVASIDGKSMLYASHSMPYSLEAAGLLGQKVASELLQQGAASIIEASRQ